MTERLLFSIVLVGLCVLSALAIAEAFQAPVDTVAARPLAPAVELPRVVITALARTT